MGRMRRFDERESIVRAARWVRSRLPGDHRLGDPLSVAGSGPPQLIGQRLAALTADRPSALRELGFGAIQAWQALSEAQGRGHGDHDLAIVFTDLVDFSAYALEAGDDRAIDLLRRVGLAIEPVIAEHRGTIVKRLGDGLMAVFEDADAAVAAAVEAVEQVERLDVGGHRPLLRAGVHVGRPRRLGGDFFGVDVNVAARVAAAAGPGEVLVSDATCAALAAEAPELRRRRRFKAKGAPKDLSVHAVVRQP
jgi:adenylate cyclase